jgi:hypothetical protein
VNYNLKFSFLTERFFLDGKKNLAKAKNKQLSKDMIGLPQPDFIHAFHIGVSGKKECRESMSDRSE